MSEKIVQFNEEIVKGKSRNLYAAAWKKRSMACWKPKLKAWHRQRSEEQQAGKCYELCSASVQGYHMTAYYASTSYSINELFISLQIFFIDRIHLVKKIKAFWPLVLIRHVKNFK